MSLYESSSPSIRRFGVGLTALGLLVVGGAAGGVVAHEFRPPIEMAPTHVVAIRNLAASAGIVTIKGRVAENFGSRLVIDDGTGRTLIDGGPHDGDTTLAPLGATVAVQGRFDRAAFHPSFLIDASGTVTPVGPPPGHHHPDHDGHRGPGDDHAAGPDHAPQPEPTAPG